MSNTKLMIGALLISLGIPSIAGARFRPNRIAKVASQPAVNSTSAWMLRTIAVPSGISWLNISYDYFVDSELGRDHLYVEYQNGAVWVVLGTYSGRMSARDTKSLPFGGPTVRVRFRYTKDAANYGGLDTAFVDNVEVRSSAGIVERFNFDEDWPGTAPAGWSSGGSAGGFLAQRPLAPRSAGRPNGQGAHTTTYLERTVQFPSAIRNHCTFEYRVDSAPAHQLRVLDGANLVFSTSGLNRGGIGEAAIGATAGGHTLRFEYAKNGAAPAGLDLALVRGISCRSNGNVIAYFDFDGWLPGAGPPSSSNWVRGCTVTGLGGSCSGLGWVVHRESPHRSYVPRQTAPIAPAVDGHILDHEYADAAGRANETRVVIPNLALQDARRGAYALYVADGAVPALHITAVVEPDTRAEVGNESGRFEIYLDSSRAQTLNRTTCGSGLYTFYAADDDRRIIFNYDVPSGQVAQTVPSFTQSKGRCGGSWGGLAAGDAPLVAGAVVRDAGSHLEIEIRIELTPGLTSDQMFGLALVRTNRFNTVHYERLPREEAEAFAVGLPDTWETIHLTNASFESALKSERDDGCCLARRRL